jgi:hypothetical protein
MVGSNGDGMLGMFMFRPILMTGWYEEFVGSKASRVLVTLTTRGT